MQILLDAVGGAGGSRRVTLRVTVDAETAQAAARIARDYSGRELETVVAAFVADMAEAAQRPGSWEHERVCAWLSSHGWECEPRDKEAGHAQDL